MNNIQTTTDQGQQGSLPSIQTIFNQYPNTICEGSDKSNVAQEYPKFLINGTGTTNNSVLMDLSTCNPSGSHIYPTNTNVTHNDFASIVFRDQFDTTETKRIQIKFQPRQKYHPRTSKESEKVAHYIRCEEGEEAEYPTIYIIPDWRNQSKKNYIEVALVDIRDRDHLYIIDNKERNSSEGEPCVVKGNDEAPNILYFRLTDEDFNNGFKTFKIELIKSKQDNIITKDLIRDRELDKSKLRFTRTFYDENGNYHRDEASTLYSCVMKEFYGDVGIEHVNPPFGPMGHNQLLDVVFTGLKAKDKAKISFKVLEETTGWIHNIKNFSSTGNTIHFQMPVFPFPRTDNVETSVNVYYEGQEIFRSPYVYVPCLDVIFDDFKLSKSAEYDVDSTTFNSSNGSNEDFDSSSCSSSTVPKNSPNKNSKKRRHEN